MSVLVNRIGNLFGCSLDQQVQFGGFLKFCRTFGVELFWSLQVYRKTRRERPKSAPYLRLKNIQGTTIVKIWKKFFKKIIFEIFFRKKVFFKSQNAEKLKKRPFRLIQRFLQTENFKKMQGGTL